MATPVRAALVTYALHCGGMEVFLLRLANILSAAQMHVDFITTESAGSWEGVAEEQGFSVHRIYRCSPHRTSRILHFTTLCRRHPYDVLFLNHSITAQAAIPFIPDRSRIFPIFHNHSDCIYSLSVRNAPGWNAAIAPSSLVASEVERRVPNRPVLHIPHGIPQPAVSLGATPCSLPPTTSIIFVGRLDDHQKGIFRLPRILAALHALGVPARLTLVGDGPGRVDLRNLFAEAGVLPHVQFVGWQTPDQTQHLLQSSHFLVLPSNYEGFGLVLAEAMACGCIPVASDLPGVTSDIVDHGQNGLLFPPDAAHDFAAGIASLVRSPDQLLRMRQDGLRKAARHFTLSQMGRRYLDLIHRSLRGEFAHQSPRLLRTGWDHELIRNCDLAPRWIRSPLRGFTRLFPSG